ncbi:G2/M phase-specific E3 ubiquitin-protein ligase [Taenia solium]|eukprot:TsM_000310500 transcript=TsM_000310500 gene=TsM_000310500
MSSSYSDRGLSSSHVATKKAACALCRNMSSNPVLGEVVVSHDLAVHLNCLYTASGLIQRVDPDMQSFTEGDHYVFGFDIQEVKAEICRGRRLRCRHCGTFGACVGCTKKVCQYSFHLPCLYDAKGFVRFKTSFEAFCYKHRPKQELVSRLLEFKDGPPICCVCLFSVAPDDDNEPDSPKNGLKMLSNGKAMCSNESATIINHEFCLKRASMRKQPGKSRRGVSINTIQRSNAIATPVSQQQPDWMCRILNNSPVLLKTAGRPLVMTMFDKWCHGMIYGGCCRLAWMHRDCIAAYARSAGLHHVKCPICFDRDIFIPTIVDFGVWVPDRDASWELESDSFATSETRRSEEEVPLSRSLEIAGEEANSEPPPTQQRCSRPLPTRRRRCTTTVSARSLSRPILQECRRVSPASFHECISKTATLVVGADEDEDKENVNPSTPSVRLTRRHTSIFRINNNLR